MMRWLLLCGIITGFSFSTQAQNPSKPASPPPRPSESKGLGEGEAQSTNDIELVEKLITARKSYQSSLENLYRYYSKVDPEKARWAEEELREFHRVTKHAYRLEMFVPVESLQPKRNIPEANELLRKAMAYKGRGSGTEAIDNQRRTEVLLQYILDKYYESDKISEVAYQLGDLYEKYRPSPQYRLSALYFERSWQWGKSSHPDARIRAARIYDKSLLDRENAIRLFKEVRTNDSDDARIQEAEKRLAELGGKR